MLRGEELTDGGAEDFPVTIETGEVSPTTTETVVASEIGSLSCCDVWVRVKADWIGRVTVSVYGRLGGARVLLQRVPLGTAVTTTDGDYLSAIVISLRGRPVRSFEVTCQANAGPGLTDGRVFLQAWHDRSGLAGSNSVGAPLVHARLVARSSTSGATTDVTVNSSGRLRVRGASS